MLRSYHIQYKNINTIYKRIKYLDVEIQNIWHKIDK
jgi:hypothetical protein